MIDNLYQRTDSGDFFCLLSDDVLLMDLSADLFKHGVTLLSSKGQMLSVSNADFEKRFDKVAEYTGDDEEVMSMIRRSNPGNNDFDFIRVFESWHETEINISGQMLELAIAATLIKQAGDNIGTGLSGSATIMTSDLQDALQNYEITRTAVPHGFRIDVKPEDD